MKFVSVLFAVALAFTGTAYAQDGTEAPPMVTTTPGGYPPPTPQRKYEEYRREELQLGIKRTRIALIATSASLAVGIALVAPAFSGDRCVENSFDNNSYSCTTAGKALLGVGSPFAIVGFWGVIVSGIMLGVRKGKLRRLNERIAYQSDAKFRWDPYRSKFVF